MPFSVMAGLVPAMVRLACGPNAWPTGAPTVSETAVRLDDVDGRDIGRSEERPSFDGLCPAMTLGRQMSRRPFHPRGPGRRPVRTRNDGRCAPRLADALISGTFDERERITIWFCNSIL